MMSVSDPLLKKLKEYILSLIKPHNTTVDDQHSSLIPLCQNLEAIYRKGLINNHTPFALTRRDYFPWIQQISQSPAQKNAIFNQAVSFASDSHRVTTVQGRGRLFIRSALKMKVMHVPIEALVRGKHIEGVYSEGSIIGDEILGEILLSLLYQLSQIKFDLNLENASFLDEMWLLPPFKHLDLCPCLDLGIYLGHVNGRAIVIKVDEGSVAAEDNNIQVGDVIDEVFGSCIHRWKKGRIASLLRQNKGLPIPMKIIKGRDNDGRIYPGLIPLYHKLNIDIECLEEEHLRNSTLERGASPVREIYGGHCVGYLGCVDVGRNGDVSHIEQAVTIVLSRCQEPIPIIMVTGEIGVQSIVSISKKVLLSHSYTEISSCGRRNDKPLCFAYIARDSNCNLNFQFTCYVFQTESEELSREILLTLADGFHRTHWAV